MKSLSIVSGVLIFLSSFAAQAQYFSKNCNKYEAAFLSDMPTSKIMVWSGIGTLASSFVHGEEKKRNDESNGLSLATGLIGLGTSVYGALQSCSSATGSLASEVAEDEVNPEDTLERREHMRALTAQAVALNAVANIVLYSNTKNLNVKSVATIAAVLPIGLLTYYWNDFQVLEPAEDEASIAVRMDSENPMLFVSFPF